MTKRLPQNYIPTSYDLFIHIVKKKKKADASVCIHFKKKKNRDSDEIVIHIKENISIKAITQNSIPLTYTISYPKLIITCSTDPLFGFNIKFILGLICIMKFSNCWGKKICNKM